MWRGPVWININYLIGLGLERYGFKDEAEKLFADTVREEERMYARYGTFFEFYDDRRECDRPNCCAKGNARRGRVRIIRCFSITAGPRRFTSRWSVASRAGVTE